MPRNFINSIRGYKSGSYWGCEGDNQYVMMTRSGLKIRTIPTIRKSPSVAIVEQQTPTEHMQNVVEEDRKLNNKKKKVKPMSALSFVTRYQLEHDNHYKEDSGTKTIEPCKEKFNQLFFSETSPNEISIKQEPTHSEPSDKEQSLVETEENEYNQDYHNYGPTDLILLDGIHICAEEIVESQWNENGHYNAESYHDESTRNQRVIGEKGYDDASAAETLLAMASGKQLILKDAMPCSMYRKISHSQTRTILPKPPPCSNIAVVTSHEHNGTGDPGHSSHSEIDTESEDDLDLDIFQRDAHSYSFDTNGNRIHKCNICQKVFTVFAAFKSHVSTHIKQKNRCTVCGKNFSRSWLLKGHMRTHTGERPYPCQHPGCDKAFADKSNLRSHQMIHNVDGKNYLCLKCNRAFAQKRYLHKHRLEVCKY